MDNFDLKKYLAEGRLQNEQSNLEKLMDELDLLVYDKYHADVYKSDNIKVAFDALVDAINNEAKINENDNPDQNQKNDWEDEYEDDSYTTYCDICDMPSTYSDDTPYGTCMCS